MYIYVYIHLVPLKHCSQTANDVLKQRALKIVVIPRAQARSTDTPRYTGVLFKFCSPEGEGNVEMRPLVALPVCESIY